MELNVHRSCQDGDTEVVYLSNVELGTRGDRFGLIYVDEDNNPSLCAFVWVDRERRYFIASGSSMTDGAPYIRRRWQQLVEDHTTDPESIELTIPQPLASEIFYSSCRKVDQHNQNRQSTLGLENKLVTHDWSLRVNLTILAICIVNT
jgi:Transposase IS4